MNSNNFQRGNITLSLNDPLDWEEFRQACEKEGVEPLSPMVYIQKVSWLFAGLKLYPEKEPRDAYLEFVAKKGKIEEIKYTPPQREPEIEQIEVFVDDGSVPPVNEPTGVSRGLSPHPSRPGMPVTRPGCGKCGGGRTR